MRWKQGCQRRFIQEVGNGLDGKESGTAVEGTGVVDKMCFLVQACSVEPDPPWLWHGRGIGEKGCMVGWGAKGTRRWLEVDYVLLIALYGISFEKEYNANPISQLKLANHGYFSFVNTFISKAPNNSIFYSTETGFLFVASVLELTL